MKVIGIPAEAQAVNDLLDRAGHDSLILEAADGRRFVLTPLRNWVAFEVGSAEDFDREVEATGQNENLFEFLSARRRGPRVSLSEAKRQLGLE